MAEFFRRAPELLAFQNELAIRLFELDLEILGRCLDVRSAEDQDEVGLSHHRLTSSEADEDVRYTECRELAREVASDGLVGIRYPSAAATWTDASNIVLFHEQSGSTWRCQSHREIGLPRMRTTDVNPLS